MAFRLEKVEYYHASVPEEVGRACHLLAHLAEMGVNLLAFSAVPCGPDRTQLTLYPRESGPLLRASENARLALEGPYPALLVQGDDEMGALARVHRSLERAGVDVFSTNGVADGRGGYGYVVHIRPSSMPHAVAALGL